MLRAILLITILAAAHGKHKCLITGRYFLQTLKFLFFLIEQNSRRKKDHGMILLLVKSYYIPRNVIYSCRAPVSEQSPF